MLIIAKALSGRPWLPVFAVVALASCDGAQAGFDLIIRGGEVYDGVATAPRRVDVGISGDRIAAIGNLAASPAALEIDARGLVVAPGFIDVQSRAGLSLLVEGYGDSHLRQGVTSVIVGDMETPALWPEDARVAAGLAAYGLKDWSGFAAYFDRLEERGTALNVGSLLPIRAAAGNLDTVRQALSEGALGVSLALDSGGLLTNSSDVNTVATLVKDHRGILAIHFTGTPDVMTGAAPRLLRVAADTGVPVVIYQPAHTDTATFSFLISQIQVARAQGAVIGATMMPGRGDVDPALAYWLRDAGASVGSRAAAVQAGGLQARKTAHTRAADAFALVLARYVREEKVIPLGQAIRQMTSNAAALFGLEERGALRVGAVADVTVFDPAAVNTAPSGASGDQQATGMHHVIVNGVPALRPDGVTGARSGRAIRPVRRGSRSPS